MTDDRAEFTANRDAGLVKRHEQRLARLTDERVEAINRIEPPVTDMVIPPGAQLAATDAIQQVLCGTVAHTLTGEREYCSDAATAALEAALPHLRVQEAGVVDLAGALRETVDAARARRLGSAEQAAPHSRPVVDREAADIKALVETATRLGRELGRREAAEEIAKAIESWNSEDVGGDAYINTGRAASIAREIATKEPTYKPEASQTRCSHCGFYRPSLLNHHPECPHAATKEPK